MMPKLSIPPKTVANRVGSSVTLTFPDLESAEAFCVWLIWLDKESEDGEEMQIKKIRPPRYQ